MQLSNKKFVLAREIMRGFWGLAFLIGCSTAAMAANPVSGVVHNQTRGQVSAGDEIILLRIDGGLQEEARTSTDAQGAFSLPLQHADKAYLLRIVHEGVNYDQRASAEGALSISVFETSPHVPGIRGTIEILRASTNGNLLHVSDMYELVNPASPAVTQAGERTFEVYLPENARISSILAAGPEKIGVMISATPVPGDPGHYTVNFPLRPGATKFAFNYDMPYAGHASFHPRRMYPVQQMAVMVPLEMKFSSPSPRFEILAAGNEKYQVRAAAQLEAGKGPEFQLAGTGEVLPDRPDTEAQTRRVPVAANSNISTSDRPALSSPQPNLPLQRRTQPEAHTFRWAAMACALLAASILILWQTGRLSGNARRDTARTATRPVVSIAVPKMDSLRMDGLKEALFQLESDRLRGSIGVDEYSSLRLALEESIKVSVAQNG
jgi:hypothetical protein